MRSKFKWIFTLLLAFTMQFSFAQEKTITGVVSDSNGPIPGANVVVKGTTKGVSTGFDGKYSIKAKEGDQLVISFMGMADVVKTVAAYNVINVLLQDGTTKLQEVVVTSFGIKKEKKDLNYSSQTVKGSDVNSVPTTNFVNNLSGKVAGLDIKRGTNFGGSTNVVLRGFKSLAGDNQALFVIDGVPVINSNVNSSRQVGGAIGYDYGNAASDLDPNSIESINVLKGASATALYGSRGQNGVIIITTKKGAVRQALGVDFSTSYTVSSIDNKTFPEYQTQYGEGYTGAFDNTYLGDPRSNFGDDASYGPAYDGSMIWQYGAFIPGSPTFGQKTAWKIADNGPRSFFNDSHTTVNSLNLSGGSDKATYRFGYTNTNGNDIQPNSYLNKNNFSGNASFKFDEKLTASFYFNYVNQYTRGRNSTGYNDNIMANFRQWWPTNVDLKEQENLYELNRGNNTWNLRSTTDLRPLFWDNPYFQRYQNYQEDTRNRYAGNASLSYQFNKNINLLARVGYDGYTLNATERRAVGSVPTTFGLPTVAQGSGFALSLWDQSETNYDLISTYNYDLTSKLKFNGTLGFNTYKQTFFNELQSTSGGLNLPGVYTIANSVGALPLPILTETKILNYSEFVQGALNYDDTYYLEGTYRREQSSSLAPGKNDYGYWSVLAGLTFSNWLKDKENSWLSYGKIRASYAVVGSATQANRLRNSYVAVNPFGTVALSQYNTTGRTDNLKNQDLKSKEIGINAQFFNNRLGFDVAWFQNDAFDQILAIPTSYTTGFGAAIQNAGNLRTRGFEVSFNATPIKTDNFAWNMNLNWSNPKSVTTELPDGQLNVNLANLQGGISINAPLNQDYGQIWGTDFVYDDQGNKVIGANGAYLKTATTDNNLGSFQPDWIGGLTNKFSYKSLSLSFLIDVKKGGKIFSLDQYYGYGTGLYPDSVGINDLGNPVRNSLANGGGEILAGVMENPLYVPGNGQPQYVPNTTRLDREQSSQVLDTDPPAANFVYDATFVKLRELAISYDLTKLLNVKSFRNVTFSVIGNNLWILYKKLPYSDPEAGLSSGNIQGYQTGPMPLTRNISFNLKLSL